jgi:hypothetical protein
MITRELTGSLEDALDRVETTSPKPEASGFRQYVLAELRCARLRARLAALDIECTGIALKIGLIEPEVAFEWLCDAGALKFPTPMASTRQAHWRRVPCCRL